MFIFPQINPVAFSLGPLQIHWYGLMYLAGFILAYLLGLWRMRHLQLPWTKQEVSDLIFYGAIGVIIGGRLGYMLFYTNGVWLHNPWLILKIWQGGMSFHGGLLGVAAALWFFAYKTKKSFLVVADFIAPVVPLGLGLGRIGNFINGELWGRITDVPWAVVFPQVDLFPRHPSQLYEMFLEGVVLFVFVWCYALKPKAPGAISGVFLIGYALCRLIVECFRQPDIQLGFLFLNTVTMGQLLSIPMFLVGLWLWWSRRNANIS